MIILLDHYINVKMNGRAGDSTRQGDRQADRRTETGQEGDSYICSKRNECEKLMRNVPKTISLKD